MANILFKTNTNEQGGRVLILLLLFLLAIYLFFSTGFSAYAIVCALPLMVFAVILVFHFQMITFWVLIVLNYFLQWHHITLPAGIPMSLYNEMFELLLIGIALINIHSFKYKRLFNAMFFTLILWGCYCTLQIFNDTCGLGMNVGPWFTGARMMAYQLIYAFLVFTLYISTPNRVMKFLYVWGSLAFFASFWVWRQKYVGFTPAENAWLQGPGSTTHILQNGTLIRYFSVFGDSANFGIGIASTAVAFIIFGITSKIKTFKIFSLVVGSACTWALFPSGTRTAIACLMAGFMAYIFLSKSLKIAIPFTIVFGMFVFMLAFTNIGQGNQQIRRMRSVFDKNDASAGQRSINQETMRKYMREAPWGIGLGMSDKVPKNNKYWLMSVIPPDSEYVFIWLRTGIIGITIFLILTAIMLGCACWIVFFKLKSSSLRGIGAGFCCAMVSQQLGGYGNQVLMQFPNCLTFYGGLAIVYVLPYIEQEWIEYEKKAMAPKKEKKRSKLDLLKALNI